MFKQYKKTQIKIHLLAGLIACSMPSLVAAENQTQVVNSSKVIASPVDAVLPMLFGLGSILLVIFILAYLFKKFTNFGSASKNIKVLESHPLGPREKLLIVKVRDQELLLGVTKNSINQLSVLETKVPGEKLSDDKKEEIKSTSQQEYFEQIPFANVLSKLIKNKPTDAIKRQSKMESVK